MKQSPDKMIPLSDKHRDRVLRDGPRMLARRSGPWIAERAWTPLEPAFAAVVSLAGLWLFGWAADSVVLFSLACVWNGMCCDIAKLAFAGAAVDRDVDRDNEERSYWAIANAIRAGQASLHPAHMAAYSPRVSSLFDIVFGAIATFVIVSGVRTEERTLLAALTGDAGVFTSLVVALALQWFTTIFAIIRSHRPGEHPPLRVLAGTRGLGLLAVVLLVLLGDTIAGAIGIARATGVATSFNVGLLLLAAMMAGGTALQRSEAAWLREYLRMSAAARNGGEGH